MSGAKEFNGIWIPPGVLYDDKLGVSEKLLLSFVYNLARRGEGLCFASDGYLSEIMGVEEKTIQNRISNLISMGYLERIGYGHVRKLKIIHKSGSYYHDAREEFCRVDVLKFPENRESGDEVSRNPGKNLDKFPEIRETTPYYRKNSNNKRDIVTLSRNRGNFEFITDKVERLKKDDLFLKTIHSSTTLPAVEIEKAIERWVLGKEEKGEHDLNERMITMGIIRFLGYWKDNKQKWSSHGKRKNGKTDVSSGIGYQKPEEFEDFGEW